MEPIDTATIVAVVIASGSDAKIEEGSLLIFPVSNGGPVVYSIPPNGFARRMVIEIAKRCGIPSHKFWHPTAYGASGPGEAAGPKKKASKVIKP